jgi:hypothetical protein
MHSIQIRGTHDESARDAVNFYEGDCGAQLIARYYQRGTPAQLLKPASERRAGEQFIERDM